MKKTNIRSKDDGTSSYDNGFWEGFDAAIEMVINNILYGGFFDTTEIADLFAEEIIDEVELYKKDG